MLCAINPSIYSEVDKLSLLFRTAIPFPHVVIDDFLNEFVADGLLKDFPKVSVMHHSHHYLFAKEKYDLSCWSRVSNLFSDLHTELLSNKFQIFVSKITGENLFMDSNCYGEVHQGLNGSFLDMHTDFNLHPYQKNWLHRINVIIYLNKNWKEEYGGALRLRWGLEGTINEVFPLFNRCVIMLSDDTTYHGYSRMSLPEGVTRKSILTNLYKEELPNRVPPRRTTTWVPDKTSVIKRGTAKLYNPIVLLKKLIIG